MLRIQPARRGALLSAARLSHAVSAPELVGAGARPHPGRGVRRHPGASAAGQPPAHRLRGPQRLHERLHPRGRGGQRAAPQHHPLRQPHGRAGGRDRQRHQQVPLLHPHRQPPGHPLHPAQDSLVQGESAGGVQPGALVHEHQGLHLRPHDRAHRLHRLLRRIADHGAGHQQPLLGGGSAEGAGHRQQPHAQDHPGPRHSRQDHPAGVLPHGPDHRNAGGHRRRQRLLHGPGSGHRQPRQCLHLHRLQRLGLPDSGSPRAGPQGPHLQLSGLRRQGLPRDRQRADRRSGLRLGAQAPAGQSGGRA